MMFISCVLFCCTWVTSPTEEWNKRDDLALRSAKKRCREIYKESKCLIKFKKVEENIYRATCGKENNL